MATLLSDGVVVNERNVRCQAAAVDDGDEHPDEKQARSASSVAGVSALSEDYVEERYKVDRRKLEQMIQGKRKQKVKNFQFSGRVGLHCVHCLQ